MHKKVSGYLAIAVMAVPIAAYAQPSAVSDSGTMTVPFVFDGKRPPVWGGGALVVADGPVVSPNIFMAFNRDGRQVFDAGFSIPGASKTTIDGFARGADGTVALCGQSYASDGRGAPFIALISADGDSQQVIRTEPYMPVVVAVAPDGTLWTVGLELNFDTHSEKGVNREAGVLRHYDRNGKSLGAFIPRSIIKDTSHLTLQGSMLAATADRVGWLHYDVTGRAPGAYVEVSRDGKVSSYPLPQPQGDQPNFLYLCGMAITDSGDVFAVVGNFVNKQLSSFTLVVLNRSKGLWLPVRMPISGRWALLLGSAGDELALMYGPGSSYSTIHFFAPDKK